MNLGDVVTKNTEYTLLRATGNIENQGMAIALTEAAIGMAMVLRGEKPGARSAYNVELSDTMRGWLDDPETFTLESWRSERAIIAEEIEAKRVEFADM
jgi:hypothetical protein